MGATKRLLEETACRLQKDDITDPEVIRAAEEELKRRVEEQEEFHRWWRQQHDV